MLRARVCVCVSVCIAAPTVYAVSGEHLPHITPIPKSDPNKYLYIYFL